MAKIAPEKEKMNNLFAEAEAYKPPSAMEVLTSEPEITDVITVKEKKYLDIKDPEIIKENIDQGLRTLREIAADGDARSSDRLNAAKALLETGGLLKGGSTVNVIKAENAQINNNESSEDSQKLLEALNKLPNLLKATNTGIEVHEGGQGC